LRRSNNVIAKYERCGYQRRQTEVIAVRKAGFGPEPAC
jgi:hypothetical protein